MKEFLKTYEFGKVLSKRRTSPLVEVHSMKTHYNKRKSRLSKLVTRKYGWGSKTKEQILLRQ